MTPELETLTQRLEEIEKQIAHLASLIVEQSDANRTVVANQFVVKDKQGVRRAELGMPAGDPPLGPWLGLFDGNGNVRACVGVGGEEGDGPAEGWVELYNEKNKAVVQIRVEDSHPTIGLQDPNGNNRVLVTVVHHDDVMILLQKDGKPELTLMSGGDSKPSLVMCDASGEPRLKLALETEGPRLVMSGNNENVNLVVQEAGPCLVFGKDNKVIWSAP